MPENFTMMIGDWFEIDHIEAIVEKIKANIAPRPLHVGEDPVGLEYCTEEVRSLLDMKPNDNTVCMLGIYGLGGIGKTELAKALYNKIAHQFDAASFLANVREKSNKINGLEDLQKTLLSEMFEEPKSMLGSTSRGIEAIKHRLRKRKILLVLDDVDNIEQLKNLAGGCDWFGLGSRIIITTRDKGLIDHKKDFWKPYEMKKLNDHHSLELFCQNAFGKSNPETGYEDMCSRAVGYAKGLPLALKVIGSDLAAAGSLEDWEDILKEYERSPHEKVLDVLKISYNRLGPNVRTTFLDIACFFKGERLEYTKKILEEFRATSSIKELVNKSLLTVEHGCLNMHDLIQDMGRDIVKQEAPYNPGKRSRLWFHQDVIDVLADDSGSDAIQGIMLDPPQRKEVDWSNIAFKKMKCLRILIVRDTFFTSEPTHLPNYLRLLDWVEYPSKSFPPKFHPRNIIIFNLTKSQLTLEEPFKKYSCLTIMNFSHNQSITAMPDVSEVKSLRELRLDSCKNLIAVHESIGFLEHLAHLSASGCTKLRNFLKRMSLPSLEVLDLNFCVKLEHFPEIVNNMNKSLKIFMIKTAIEELPDSIGYLTGLVSIEMQSCWKLKYLPSSLFKLPKIVALKIEGCSQLRESFRRFLHDVPSAANGRSILKSLYFGKSGLQDGDLQAVVIYFPKLEELIASENNFVSLPACIKDSVHLTNLDVSGCHELQDIPKCTNLRILNVHHCVKLEHISELPSTVQKVDARYCFSLSRETSDMLWYQVKKERCGLEIVMPQTMIPEWYDYRGEGGNPCFWARGKFPIVAFALVFTGVNRRARHSRRQLVELQLVINGRSAPHKGYYNFRVEADHVLVCDLRLLFSKEEWQGLDALLVHEWNQVQVSYEAPYSMRLCSWGVFVYKQGTTNMGECVQFMCPDPKYSVMANVPAIVPAIDAKWEQRKMVEELGLDNLFDGKLRESLDFEDRDTFGALARIAGTTVDKDFVQEQHYALMRGLKKISEEARDVLEGKPLDDENSTLAFILRTIKKDRDKDGPTNFDHEDGNGMKPSMNNLVGEGEASSRSGHQGNDAQQQEPPTVQILELDWTKVKFPTSDNPFFEVSMMMKHENCEPEAVSELHRMLKEVNRAQGKKLIEKFKSTQSAQSISNKRHKLDASASSSSIEMLTDIEKEGCSRVVTRGEKLADALQGRLRELRRLYDAGIEGFQNPEEIQDLMSAISMNGLRDEVLEEQAMLLAHGRTTATVIKENEEHVITDQKDVTADAAAPNENPDETIDDPWDPPNPLGQSFLRNLVTYFTIIMFMTLLFSNLITPFSPFQY